MTTCEHADCGWCYKENTRYEKGCVGINKCVYHWPDEERIDMIGHNGGEALHYLDVKKQMLSVPTDGEVIEWFRLLRENIDLDMYRTQNGNYNVAINRPNKNCFVKTSDISYLDCLKQIIMELSK